MPEKESSNKSTHEITPNITVTGVSEKQVRDIEEAVVSAATASSTHISDWKFRHVWGG